MTGRTRGKEGWPRAHAHSMGMPRTALLLFLLLFGAAQAAPDGPGPGPAPFASSGGSAGACLRKAGHAPRQGGRWTDERLADTLATRADNTAPWCDHRGRTFGGGGGHRGGRGRTFGGGGGGYRGRRRCWPLSTQPRPGAARLRRLQRPWNYRRRSCCCRGSRGPQSSITPSPRPSPEAPRPWPPGKRCAPLTPAPASSPVTPRPLARADELDAQHGPHQRRARVPPPP